MERSDLSPQIEVMDAAAYPATVAAKLEQALPASGSIIITGGTTAAKIYANLDGAKFDDLAVFFSDERCVPPDHPESNYKMATELFLGTSTATVHRMEGELTPAEGARRYHGTIQPFVADGIGLMLLGMGADCHVGALYPQSGALDAADHCAAVSRPDGLEGLTLTPHAMLAARSIKVFVTGAGKAEALVRVLRGDEDIKDCPARLLVHHPAVTFMLDDEAASKL